MTEHHVGVFLLQVLLLLRLARALGELQRREKVDVLAFFHRTAIELNLRGTTRWEVIDELCERLAQRIQGKGTGNPAIAVREREELAGTGTGDGVAIPHARMAGLDRHVLAFGRSVAGVEWNAPDGLPVHLVFVLLTPEREHGLQLQIVAALARGLGDEQARERLLHAESENDVWWALRGFLGREPGRFRLRRK